MPTNRLNISLVDKDTITKLKELRKILQNETDKEEISFSRIIQALLEVREYHISNDTLIKYL